MPTFPFLSCPKVTKYSIIRQYDFNDANHGKVLWHFVNGLTLCKSFKNLAIECVTVYAFTILNTYYLYWLWQIKYLLHVFWAPLARCTLGDMDSVVDKEGESFCHCGTWII